MIGEFHPYSTGEIRKSGNKKVMICGHIWWPVEQCNAYHCVKVNAQNEPVGEPEYIWDHSHGKWPLVGTAA